MTHPLHRLIQCKTLNHRCGFCFFSLQEWFPFQYATSVNRSVLLCGATLAVNICLNIWFFGMKLPFSPYFWTPLLSRTLVQRGRMPRKVPNHSPKDTSSQKAPPGSRLKEDPGLKHFSSKIEPTSNPRRVSPLSLWQNSLCGKLQSFSSKNADFSGGCGWSRHRLKSIIGG